jgi:NAD dependent epimerase/dehydratase family
LFFGCRLPNHPNLRVMKGDIRDTKKPVEALQGQEAVLHLACISNDASFEVDEKLSEKEGGRPAFCLLLVKLGLWGMRPNLHVEDMVDAYHVMLTAPAEKIHGETFNIGFQNHSIAEIANLVKKVAEEEMPEKGRSRSSRRRPMTCAPITSIQTR